MYLQQTRIHQFMINVFYRDDFENSGEKNKRGSVDLDIFTGRKGVFDSSGFGGSTNLHFSKGWLAADSGWKT